MSDLRKRPYLACEQGGVFKEWYMEPADCPNCERVLNGSATSTGHELPPGLGDHQAEGDDRDSMLAYTDGLKLRPATLAESAQLLGDAYWDARLALQLNEPRQVRMRAI